VNVKVGIPEKYDNNILYDDGRKYDGGTEVFQIERIRYKLVNDDIQIMVNFGPIPSSIVDDLAKLEYQITNERNT